MDFAVRYGIDLFLLAQVVLETVWHAKKGFVRTMLTLLAALIAFGVALKVAEPLASWSYDTFLDKTVCERIEEHASEFSAAQSTKEVINEAGRLIPGFLGKALKKADVNLENVNDQIDSAGSEEAMTSQQISNRIIKPAAVVVLKIICTLLCYAVLMAFFRVIIRLIDKVAKLPVLRSANRLLGGALGFLKGLLIVYLLALLCGLTVRVTDNTQVIKVIEHSQIVSACQQINFNSNSDNNKKE